MAFDEISSHQGPLLSVIKSQGKISSSWMVEHGSTDVIPLYMQLIHHCIDAIYVLPLIN